LTSEARFSIPGRGPNYLGVVRIFEYFRRYKDLLTSQNVLSDYELLALFKGGDRGAYEDIYRRYWAVLFAHARRMVQNDEDAKDLVQDVFSVFWIDGPTLELQTTLSAYLYSICRYKVFNLIDRKKVRSDYLSSLEDFIKRHEYSGEYLVREKQMEELIEREISALPPKMREVFELSRKANLNYRQIAEKLNISDNTVKKQMSNALKILRSRLGVIFDLFFY
jgi:RNA polymerase sigma-70 factor (family 1)